MKRYQIHLTKTVDAEITVEADSEHIARNYALSLPHNRLVWSETTRPQIVHVEEIAVFAFDDNPGE